MIIPNRKDYFDKIKEKKKVSTSYLPSLISIRKQSVMRTDVDLRNGLIPLKENES